MLEPRSRGFPEWLLDRAFYARVKPRQNPKARFSGPLWALAAMLKLLIPSTLQAC